MTADEFRKMLDRFHAALTRADEWSQKHGPQYIETEWHLELDGIWRNLNRECALMEEAETRLITTLDQTAIQPTRPLPDPPESVRGSATEANAEAIGKLQAKVAQLEGTVDSLRESHYRLQGVAIGIQERELERLAEVTSDSQPVEAPIEAWYHKAYSALDETEHQPCRAILDELVRDMRCWLAAQESGAERVPETNPHCHEASNLRCLVAHGDDKGNEQPPCIQCKRCGEFVRPEAMGQECPGKPATTQSGWSDSKPVGNDVVALADGSVPG